VRTLFLCLLSANFAPITLRRLQTRFTTIVFRDGFNQPAICGKLPLIFGWLELT
jgi:hypothetical protein